MPEIEVKIKIEDRDAAKEKILGIKAELFKQRHLQVDEYFDNRKKLQGSDQVLRLRDNCVLTYKGPQQKKFDMKVREEIELMIDDGPKMKEIFEKLGYVYCKRKEKYREAYILGSTVITLDETPMGLYMEIEGSQENVAKVAAKLGFEKKQWIVKTYWVIWKEYAEKNNIKGTDMVFQK